MYIMRKREREKGWPFVCLIDRKLELTIYFSVSKFRSRSNS